MMLLYALGSLALVTGAWIASVVIALRAGHREGREAVYQEAIARVQLRDPSYAGSHRLDSFPDEIFEKMATTGELRQLAYDGDIGEIERENTAFFRRLDLRRWVGAA